MRIQHVLTTLVPALSLGALFWLLLQPRDPGSPPEPAVGAAAGRPVAEPSPPPPAAIPAEVWNRFRPMDFREIFRMPAGDFGLEFKPGFAAAAGQEVRFTGHMVQHPHEDHTVFLLTPQPMRLNMTEYGLADDLPPWAMHVVLPETAGSAPAWTGARLTVCGILEIGNRQEKDGRISPMRLLASHIVDPATRAEVEVMKPVVLQKDRVRTAPRSAP